MRCAERKKPDSRLHTVGSHLFCILAKETYRKRELGCQGLGPEGSIWLQRESTREFGSCGMEMFCTLIVVLIAWFSACVKTHRTIHQHNDFYCIKIKRAFFKRVCKHTGISAWHWLCTKALYQAPPIGWEKEIMKLRSSSCNPALTEAQLGLELFVNSMLGSQLN